MMTIMTTASSCVVSSMKGRSDVAARRCSTLLRVLFVVFLSAATLVQETTCQHHQNRHVSNRLPPLNGQRYGADHDSLDCAGYCKNGATCRRQFGSSNSPPSCICVNGWTGPRCDVNIDDCATAPCHNGGTCRDRVGSFECECPAGKTGLLCQLDDACVSSPCRAEGAICDTSPVTGAFVCTCPNGLTGQTCDTDIDECALLGSTQSPCEHGGHCINTLGSFRCQCPAGLTGARCEVNINECDSSPCLNQGTCLDERGAFRCVCMPGYTGVRCQEEVDECASNPCQNGAICTDLVNGYRCVCAPGFTGATCQQNVDDCSSNPCLNGATCRDSLDSYSCQCRQGFSGERCAINIDDCLNDPCRNGGTCSDLVNGFRCACPAGFSGKLCQSRLPATITCANSTSNPCMFGGQCVDAPGSSLGFRCLCPKGTAGARCEQNLNECWGSPCLNGATCIDLVNGFKCHCPAGWTGDTCSLDVDECSLHLGHHQRDGYQDNEARACLNGATCVNTPGSFHCLCPSGFAGSSCTNDIDDCATSPCSNGGTCHDHGAGFSCSCPAGFGGERCERRQSTACAFNPCEHGGTCLPSDSPSSTALTAFGRDGPLDGYKCICAPGYEGENCRQNIDECSVEAAKNGGQPVCLNGGSCLDGVDGFACLCPLPWSGARCNVSLDPCIRSTCARGSTCQASADLKTFVCACAIGYTGPDCQLDVDECALASLPQASSWRLPGSRSSQRPVCLNGGRCVNTVGSFKCRCADGFAGAHCEQNIDECNPNPCFNGATCLDGVNSFQCLCPADFGGLRCETRGRGVCSDSTLCLNGGHCRDLGQGDYTCSCARGWSGRNCERNDDDCGVSGGHSPCLNGGRCVDLVDNFRCDCLPSYEGRNCERPRHHNTSNGFTNVSGKHPWARCPQALSCWSLFKNGRCDEACNSAACLFDGGDCDQSSPDDQKCNELYDAYCISNYDNGYCDQGCNNRACGYDGLDCAQDPKSQGPTAPKHLQGTLVLNLDTQLSALELDPRRMTILRRELASLIGGAMLLSVTEMKADANGKAQLKLSLECAPTREGDLSDGPSMQAKSFGSGDGRCFGTSEETSQFLEAIFARQTSSKSLPLSSVFVKSVSSEPNETGGNGDHGSKSPMAWTVSIVVILVCLLLLAGVLTNGGGYMSRSKLRKSKAVTWFPEGFFGSGSGNATSTSRSLAQRRHGNSATARAAGGGGRGTRERIGYPDGQEMRSFNGISNDKTKAFGEEEEGIYDEPLEPRAWTQQHLDAIGQCAVASPMSFPPSPTQPLCPTIDNYTDVLGPGGLTPLMVAAAFEPRSPSMSVTQHQQQMDSLMASHHANQLSPQSSHNSNDCTSNQGGQDFLTRLIEAGASLSQQSEAFGETALHLAARFARADAAKRLLDAGADCNVQDHAGRTPLHTAVSADARGVFELLLRSRATNLNARMVDGSTPLILAARGAQEGMLEELILAEADYQQPDEQGRTALHWAASVNNVQGIRALLSAGANRDAQSARDETPLFVACREGSAQAARALIDAGANRDITDHMDRLPRDVALERMHHDLVRLLDTACPPSEAIMTLSSPQGHTLVNSPPQHQVTSPSSQATSTLPRRASHNQSNANNSGGATLTKSRSKASRRNTNAGNSTSAAAAVQSSAQPSPPSQSLSNTNTNTSHSLHGGLLSPADSSHTASPPSQLIMQDGHLHLMSPPGPRMQASGNGQNPPAYSDLSFSSNSNSNNNGVSSYYSTPSAQLSPIYGATNNQGGNAIYGQIGANTFGVHGGQMGGVGGQPLSPESPLSASGCTSPPHNFNGSNSTTAPSSLSSYSQQPQQQSAYIYPSSAQLMAISNSNSVASPPDQHHMQQQQWVTTASNGQTSTTTATTAPTTNNRPAPTQQAVFI